MENKWIEWTGGHQPAEDDVLVEVGLECGVIRMGSANMFKWGRVDSEHDIVKYRVVGSATVTVSLDNGAKLVLPASTPVIDVCEMVTKLDAKILEVRR